LGGGLRGEIIVCKDGVILKRVDRVLDNFRAGFARFPRLNGAIKARLRQQAVANVTTQSLLFPATFVALFVV
jgi:hypothetical protein